MLGNHKVQKSIVMTLMLLSLFLLTKFVSEVKAMRFIGSSPANQSIISVQGKGEVVKIPDLATFSFSVTEESLVVSEAQSEAAKQINAILEYLKKNGVDEKDIDPACFDFFGS